MPINDPNLRPRVDDLPENIKQAFRETALIPLPSMAKLLGVHRVTLAEHIKDHQLPYRQSGRGKKAPRRSFGIDDAAVLWHSLKCQMAPRRSSR